MCIHTYLHICIYIYIYTHVIIYTYSHIYSFLYIGIHVESLKMLPFGHQARVGHGRNSRDNMTCMIMHFADGSEWTNYPDEMKNYEKLLGSCWNFFRMAGWLKPSLFEKIWVVQPERLDEDDGEPSLVTPTSFPRVESTTSRRLPQWQRGSVLRLVDGDRDASAGMFLWGLPQGIDRPPEMGVSGNEIYCTGVYP